VILVTFVSLTFVGSSGLLQAQVNQMKDYWYDKVQVAIFLCNSTSVSSNCPVGSDGQPTEVTEAQRDHIAQLLSSPQMKQYVQKYTYESPKEAYKHFKDQFGNSDIASSVTPDQLPGSFRVKLSDPEKYPVINEQFSSQPGVDSVADQRDYLDTVFKLINAASVIAIVIAVVMLVCAVLMIATTIRLSAFSRRRETGIMRLVGASRTVIQLPFVLEGVVAAAIGAILSSAVLWAVLQFVVQDRLAPENPGVAFIGPDQMWWVAPILIAIGVVLAGLSSMLTLRRYLKV
jgi:cell division transport system permease protein